jgi:flagellar hook assembly protein FlgD
MPRAGDLSVRIFNVRGELVRVLLDEPVPAGKGQLNWDGTDDVGQAVAAGVYFARSQALGETQIEKVALVR